MGFEPMIKRDLHFIAFRLKMLSLQHGVSCDIAPLRPLGHPRVADNENSLATTRASIKILPNHKNMKIINPI